MNVDLVMADMALVQSLASDPSALRGMAANWDKVQEEVLSSVGATLVLYERTRATAPWLSYFAKREGELVGICSFAAPPAAGLVEIAYFTFPPYERRGIASAMVAELVRIAFNAPEISAVVAHTAPEENASTHILRKLGFLRDGSIQDDEIGEAWRWRKSRTL